MLAPRRIVERLSLRSKLVGIAALGIAFAIAVGLVGLVGLGALDRAGAEAARINAAQSLQSAAMRELETLRADVLTAGIATAAASPSERILADSRTLQSILRDLSAADIRDAAIAKRIAEFAQLGAATAAAARQIAGESTASWSEFTADLAATETASDGVVADLRTAYATSAQKARDARSAAHLWILLAAGLAGLALLATSHLLSRSILRVLRHIGEVAAAVANGHLSARARIPSNDEIGRLGAAFDEVADSLTSLLIRMESDAKRIDFGRQLGEAMEMVDTEPDVHRVVEQAFTLIDPSSPMELLLADSSRAHLERAAVSPTAGAAGCGVVSPYSCVAVRKGVATTFETSEALNACHKLRERPGGACSAVCVPISFMGRSLGVLHATAPAGIPPAPELQRQLVTLSRHTGMRIGTVRAFAKTELQASTDGLTGLLNRRTLENRVRELMQTGARFALVMVDLDRFKNLNDTYGHEAGDRALRLFAQVVREHVRAEDIAGRLGGEEFVLVLNDTDVDGALPALERLRVTLAEAVGAGSGPVFTASFGVTDTTEAGEWETLLRIADAGLLRAKAEGRDRIVIGSAADAAALVARAA